MKTSKNIPEAIEYYRIFKQYYPEYNVTAIFDDSIDNIINAIIEELDNYFNYIEISNDVNEIINSNLFLNALKESKNGSI